jgi:hypothetical protein
MYVYMTTNQQNGDLSREKKEIKKHALDDGRDDVFGSSYQESRTP